jgi:hypothetical protein
MGKLMVLKCEDHVGRERGQRWCDPFSFVAAPVLSLTHHTVSMAAWARPVPSPRFPSTATHVVMKAFPPTIVYDMYIIVLMHGFQHGCRLISVRQEGV